MTRQLSPQSWAAPHWHSDFSDFGDAQGELDHLRSLANAILCHSEEFVVELQAPEPGLMFLVVHLEDRSLAEIYSIRKAKVSDERHFGVFLFPGSQHEREKYSETIGDAVDILCSACKNQMNGAAVGEVVAPHERFIDRPIA